ncbi:MAG: phytanoyl-CoA dioxygenase family protein [Planctomycetota bacterium]|nr:phytanoyl-CoA dioxygenase family protein [Planctomycetota bacterium]
MITKRDNYNRLHEGPAHPVAVSLERDGFALLRGVFSPAEVADLRSEILGIFESTPSDDRYYCRGNDRGTMFRYEMFNRSARAQAALERRELLDGLEQVLGDDCHVIACTAWRNPADPSHAPRGQEWHVDGGPHVVRPEGTVWPSDIPYPVFVVAAQVYLEPCRLEDGPTSVIPGSHMSGCLPPHHQRWDLDLSYAGRPCVAMVAEPGDVSFVVSDAWHRRLPPRPEGKGRFFLQINYGRREIAQRVLPSERMHPSTPEAVERAKSERARQLLGIHGAGFYDG